MDFGLAMHEPQSDNAWEIEKKNGSVFFEISHPLEFSWLEQDLHACVPLYI